MIIGLAGHVDHGKSTLLAALTGARTDRLAEERRRGMTIELGYAFADDRAFIDVPGHERLITTMLAGAGGIDAALLCIAADEGVMPQTREHLAVLDFLGITQGIVAITKADRAPQRLNEVANAARQLLAASALAGAPVLAVSGRSGEGLPALSAALAALAPRPRPLDALPRLPIDRAFVFPGAGLIVTGSLMSGQIAVGDRLLLSPQGIAVRVRGLHANNRPAQTAFAGARVALNLAGAEISQVSRGDWVLDSALHAPVMVLDAGLRLLDGIHRTWREGAGAMFHLAAQAVPARLSLLAKSPSPEDGLVPVRIRLSRPLAALVGDRFVLRDGRTLGGGVVYDPFPPARGAHSSVRLALLPALVAPDASVALQALLSAPPGVVDLSGFARARNLPLAQAAALRSAGVVLGDWLISPRAAVELRDRILAALAIWHAARPESPGMAALALQRALGPNRILPDQAFAALLGRLAQERVVARTGPHLHLPNHSPRLPPALAELWQKLEPLIAAGGAAPPRLRDLAHALGASEEAMRRLLRRLVRAGLVWELAPDRFYPPAAAAKLARLALAAASESEDGSLRLATFRDRAAIGRKLALEILESFDRLGLTLRRGETRLLCRPRLDLFAPSSNTSA